MDHILVTVVDYIYKNDCCQRKQRLTPNPCVHEAIANQTQLYE